LNLLGRFSKKFQKQHFMKICPLGVQLFHVTGRTDNQTDIKKLIVAFSQFFERAYKWINMPSITTGASARACVCVRLLIATAERMFRLLWAIISISTSVYLHQYIYISISTSVYLHQYIYINISTSVYLYQYIYISISTSVYLHQYNYISISTSVYLHQYIYISISTYKNS
jgi:hypothetical protein